MKTTEKRIDLHTHSTRSDGTFSPSELMRYAKEKGLAAVALTDHDTVAGIEEAAAASAETEVELVSGVELSTDFDGAEIHIIGLFIDHNDKSFLAALNLMSERRRARNADIFARLKDIGVNIDKEAVSGAVDSVTRANFAQALVKNGYCASVKEAFDRYLNQGRPAYVSREFSPPRDVIAAVRGAGGLAFLAHPVLCRLSRDNVDAMVKQLCDDGLSGIEALYSMNTPSDDVFFCGMAKKYRLLVTGGSDFHGANKANIDIGVGRGNLFVPESVLEKMKRFTCRA